MKNLFLFLVFMACIHNLTAQIQKGSVLLGGTVGINHFNEYGANVTVFNVFPKAGFFLSDRFALGGGLEFALAAGEGNTEGSLGLNVLTRVYFNKSGMSRFFAQLDVGARIPDLDAAATDILMGGGLSLGADFFLNEFVAIEGLLGYHRFQDFKADAGSNVIGLNFGVVAFIGGNKGTN